MNHKRFIRFNNFLDRLLENIVRFVTANGGGAEDRILTRDTLIVDRLRTPVAGSIILATIETLATGRPPPEPSVTAS